MVTGGTMDSGMAAVVGCNLTSFFTSTVNRGARVFQPHLWGIYRICLHMVLFDSNVNGVEMIDCRDLFQTLPVSMLLFLCW